MRDLLLLCMTCAVFACDGADPAVAPDALAAPLDAAPFDAAVLDAAPDAAAQDATVDALAFDAAPPPIGGEDRRAPVFVPEGDAPPGGWPIAVVLHGFRSNPELTIGQFPFGRTATANGWIVVYPRGLEDAEGFLHWDDYGRVPEGPGDDVPHILGVIDEVAARHGGDVDRVLVIGHSNGGAMARYLACQAPTRFKAFVNLSGANVEPERCTPAVRITGVWAHGTEDDAVSYEGREGTPGVEDASAGWAAAAGCGEAVDAADPIIGYTLTPPDAPTQVRRWPECDGGVRVERWRIEGAPHVLLTTDAFSAAVRALLP